MTTLSMFIARKQKKRLENFTQGIVIESVIVIWFYYFSRKLFVSLFIRRETDVYPHIWM